MKKVLLFVFFAITGFHSGFSQTLTLSDSTGPLANNSNISRNGHVNDDEIVCHVFVTNTTPDPIDVIVKKVEINVVSGSVNTFCWGLCFPPNIYQSPPFAVNGNRTDSVNFSGHYNPTGFVGTTLIRYVFFEQSDPSDSVCVNVTYNALEVGVLNPSAKNILSGAYPNPANSIVNFDYCLSTENAGSVVIRNLLGSVVRKSVLTGTEGKLALFTGDLPEGIYFYSLDVEGKALITRKLIVRH
jgi:hypothetical protein